MSDFLIRYYLIDKKTNAIPVESQFAHMRRFLNNIELGVLSPFIYDCAHQKNMFMAVSKAAELAELEKNKKLQPLTPALPLLTYDEWQIENDPIYAPTLDLHLVTPLAIQTRDNKVHYRSFVEIADIFQQVNDRLAEIGLPADFGINTYSGKDLYWLQNQSPTDGVVKIETVYARNDKSVRGIVGYLQYHLDEMPIRDLAYYRYVLNYLTLGYRHMAWILSYRGDLHPLQHISTDESKCFLSTHPVKKYPMIYQI